MRIQSHRPLYRTLVRALAKLGLAQRDHAKYLGNLKPYAGNTWWALSREACEYIINFEARHPQEVKFFEDCFAPEETYFHTIIGNSPFAPRMRRNLVYEDWLGQKAHPEMINEKHLAFFESRDEVSVQDHHGPGELLFARKFLDENIELLQRIDDMIQRKEQSVSEPAETHSASCPELLEFSARTTIRKRWGASANAVLSGARAVLLVGDVRT